MKRTLFTVLTLLLAASFLLGACQTGTEPEVAEEAKPDEVTLVIGFTSSITGKYETSSGRQVRGFNLWMDQVNDAGGITLSDGTVVKLEVATYDDESNTDRIQELYTRLATEDNADLLISPYSSGLTAAASIIAEQNGKVMITTGAAADSNYQQGYTQVFQIYTPASRYLTGAVDLLASVGPEVTKVAFVYEDTKLTLVPSSTKLWIPVLKQFWAVVTFRMAARSPGSSMKRVLIQTSLHY
jgi:branched-chain amino acid transport system substrate-binding protein